MLVALDLTGKMITYAYHDGSGIVTEVLRNTTGFRTSDLFQIEGDLNAMVAMAKQMIEFSGVTVTEAICAVPLYCNYDERERVKKAASACGMKIRQMIRGSLASAVHLFQKDLPDQQTAVLCSVRSDYAEFLLFNVDGDVLTVMGSALVHLDGKMLGEAPDKVKNMVQSELKALYNDLGLTFGEKKEAVYISAEEGAEAAGELLAGILGSCFETEPVVFDNDVAAGAMAHLMKLEDYRTDTIRKCFLVDCCSEGISISSGISGDLVEVFPRNTVLPAKNTVDLPISYDNVLVFYAGNFRNREYDEPIGTCRIPEAYRKQRIYVKITLNADGIVEYVVLDQKKQVINPRCVLS